MHDAAQPAVGSASRRAPLRFGGGWWSLRRPPRGRGRNGLASAHAPCGSRAGAGRPDAEAELLTWGTAPAGVTAPADAVWASTMPLLPAVGAGTWPCCGLPLTRPFSQATRRGGRPGGEELGRLPLDDLASVPRPAEGPELLFGLSPCLLALQAARRRVARLLLQACRSGLQGQRAELLRAAEARAIPVLRPRRRELDALCRHQVHQGVCMEVSPLRPRPWAEAEAARPGDDPQQLWLVLEGLQDPRNLGAVLRSAHFLGVDKVITSRRNRHGRPLFPVRPHLEAQPSS